MRWSCTFSSYRITYILTVSLTTSQLPVKKWHEYVANPTLADAILDRLVHNAHELDLSGESIRRLDATTDDDEQSVKPEEIFK